MNIHYIRAAILAATGIDLSLEEVKTYLIEEGMIAKRDANKLIFSGYGDYYYGSTTINEPVEEPIDLAEPDIELIEPIDDDVKVAVVVALNGVVL